MTKVLALRRQNSIVVPLLGKRDEPWTPNLELINLFRKSNEKNTSILSCTVKYYPGFSVLIIIIMIDRERVVSLSPVFESNSRVVHT